MKSVIFSLVVLGFVCGAGSAQASENTSLNQCLEICRAEAQPGYEMRSCVAGCLKKYGTPATAWGQALEALSAKCETYEEDCERGGDDPWGGL